MRHIVLGGDFNCITDPGLDSKNTNTVNQGTRGSPELLRTIKHHGLVDAWRNQNPKEKRFTWHNGDNTQATRIDRIYLSRELSVGSQNEIIAFPSSDHDMIQTKITTQISSSGKGFWHLNTSLLENSNFKSTIKFTWKEWAKRKTDYQNILDRWDEGKIKIKRAVISFSADEARKRSSEYNGALKELNQLQKRIDNGEENLLPQLKMANLNVQKTTQKQHGGSPNPCKIPGEDNANQPHTKDPDSKRLQSLKDRGGRTTEDPAQMTGLCRDFYRDLYTATPVNQEEIEFFLGSIDLSLGQDDVSHSKTQ